MSAHLFEAWSRRIGVGPIARTLCFPCARKLNARPVDTEFEQPTWQDTCSECDEFTTCARWSVGFDKTIGVHNSIHTLGTVSSVKEGPVPLSYGYSGRALRLYIEDSAFEGNPKDEYHKEPGVVAFLDLFDQGSQVFIAYMHTTHGHTGKGYARKLAEEVYRRYADGERWIDWGEVYDEHAGTLVKKFKETYPKTSFKVYW